MDSQRNHDNVVQFLDELATTEDLPMTTIDTFALRRHFLVHTRGKPDDFGSPRTHLGSLKLPPEILQRILSEVDVNTLYHFRRVNRFAIQTVHGIPAFSWLLATARDVLRAIVGTRISNFASLNTLYDTICTPNCSSCDDFAPFIYLLTCSRVCYSCLTSTRACNPDTQLYTPMPVERAADEFKLNSRSLDALPRMITLPGFYGRHDRSTRFPVSLVDYGAARAMSRAQHEPVLSRAQRGEMGQLRQQIGGLRSDEPLPIRREVYRGLVGGGIDRNEAGLVTLLLQPYRFMATVRAPWLDRRNGTVSVMRSGWACKACEGMSLGPQNWRRRFTVEQFVKHVLNECEGSRSKINGLLKETDPSEDVSTKTTNYSVEIDFGDTSEDDSDDTEDDSEEDSDSEIEDSSGYDSDDEGEDDPEEDTESDSEDDSEEDTESNNDNESDEDTESINEDDSEVDTESDSEDNTKEDTENYIKDDKGDDTKGTTKQDEVESTENVNCTT